MKAAINKYVFFPALLLGLGFGYTVLHRDREKIVGEGGAGSPLLRSFSSSSSHTEKPEVLPVLRARQKVREFRSSLTADPARDWARFVSLGEKGWEMQKALLEHWARHCPRQAWQFLDSPEFRKKYDGHIGGQLKSHLFSAWLESSPEEAWDFGESIVASGSEKEARREILREMAAFRGREKTEDALEWVLSLPSDQKTGKQYLWSMPRSDRETALYELLSYHAAFLDKQRGDEWAASLQKYWPRLQCSVLMRSVVSFATNSLEEEKAELWIESLPLSALDRKAMQQEFADRKISDDIFDTDDNLRETLSKTAPERRRSVFLNSCFSNEEELRQYAASLPEGEKKAQALVALCEYSQHMEYKDRLALLKNVPQNDEKRGQALYRLSSEWGQADFGEVIRVVEESSFLSEGEKQEVSSGGRGSISYIGMTPGHMEKRPFYAGKMGRFNDKYVNFSDAAANAAPEK